MFRSSWSSCSSNNIAIGDCNHFFIYIYCDVEFEWKQTKEMIRIPYSRHDLACCQLNNSSLASVFQPNFCTKIINARHSRAFFRLQYGRSCKLVLHGSSCTYWHYYYPAKFQRRRRRQRRDDNISVTMTMMTMTIVIHHLVLSKNVLPTTNIFIIICSSSFSSSSHDFLVHFRPIHKYYKYYKCDKQSSRSSSRFKY